MPQRISDVALTRLLEFHAESRYSLDLALDLHDARAEIKALFNECVQRRTCYEELEEALKIAVAALEREKDHCCCYTGSDKDGNCGNPQCTAKGIQTALDRIKGIG